MAITVTVNAQWYEATLSVDGLAVGTDYTVLRQPFGDPVRTWTADNTSTLFRDLTPQVGVDQWYSLHPAGQLAVVLQTSSPFTIDYQPDLRPDQPLWDTNVGAWPVLRTVNGKWLEPLRLPVADYTADFGYRSNVYQVVGSAYPVVASDVAVMKQGALVVLTANNQDRGRLMEYIRHQRVVHLASPCVDGLQHMFFRVLGVSETVPVKRRPLLRQWQIKFQQVPRPGWYGAADWNGGRTWGQVRDGSTTWADATTQFGATWLPWRGTPTNIGPARAADGTTRGKTGLVDEGSW